MAFVELHTHCDIGSNTRLIDTINRIESNIDYCIQLGHQGMAVTDHECLSAHIKALNHMKEVKQAHPDFQLILGNEIYLCHDAPPLQDDQGRPRYDIQSSDFHHFILLAKDGDGHKQLRTLSSRAWERCYHYKNIDRVPTFYSDIEEVVAPNRGHLIASTACLGGEFPKLVLEGNVDKCEQFVDWCIQMFGQDNFFVELQPGRTEEQTRFNSRAVKFCRHFGLRWIITNDAHYLTKDKRLLHDTFLKSHEEERETGDFYESTYFKSEAEMIERMQDYLSFKDIQAGFDNTVLIGEMCKDAGDYGLFHPTIVPQRTIHETPKVIGILSAFYNDCPSIKYLAESPYEQDRFFLRECEKGLINKNIPITKEVAKRIDIEVQQLLGISEKLGCRMTSYYNLMQELEDVIWQVSIIGPGRGSACCLYCAYLMDIHQVDSLKENLPYWRHTHVSKVSLPDIDIDLSPSKRPAVFELLKEKYGRDHCLNIVTFKTETLKSAIKTACRGNGIDNDAAQEMANLVPSTRGRVWSYKECQKGNEDNGYQPITELINLINQYPGLHSTIEEIEGLITARGSHASGFYIFPEQYLEHNSLMRAPSGLACTCWEMEDSDACGALKFDLLVTDACEKIQTAMELLMKDGRMKWQGSWKDTYNQYIHPDVLVYDDPAMWDCVGRGEIADLFQFMSDVGIEAVRKIKPRSIRELSITSSIMRLMSDDGESPIDRYVAFRNDISLWYREMREYGLNEAEIAVLEKYLKGNFGCSVEQEDVMELSMESKISGFDMSQADALRKVIGKKLVKKLPGIKEMFYKKGEEQGTRKVMLDYVWAKGFLPQLGYAFNRPHVLAYALVALQEMSLYYNYPHIYWQCAVLTVNASAGDDSEDADNSSTNYGKIAKAISSMQHQGVQVALPAVNSAGFGFKPDAENNRIVFGLKAINGIGDDVASAILANKPYTSVIDFYQKNPNFQTKTMVNLIKAGAFDELEAPLSRVEIMKEYVRRRAIADNPPKQSIDMKNFKTVLELGILPQDFAFMGRVTNFRAYIKTAGLSDGGYNLSKLNDSAQIFFDGELYRMLTEGEHYHFLSNGDTVVDAKPFEKWYKEAMKPVSAWIKHPSTLALFNQALCRQAAIEIYEKNCKGTIPHWEMESLSFYHTEHELAHVNAKQYGIDNFSAIPSTPVMVSTNGKEKYQLYRIAGTVLDKNKTRHSITLLTTDGVVNVKLYAGSFSNYDKQISEKKPGEDKKTVLEKSWFTRGTMLLIAGIRRGDTFFPKKYYDSIYQHTICKIDQVGADGSLILRTERCGAEEKHNKKGTSNEAKKNYFQ